MRNGRPPVVIVGAGLSGLVAANALAGAGCPSIVFDEARGPGGRLATRRVPGVGGRTARLDHGAQFFTVRSPDFADIVHEWRRASLVREWCRGFGPEGDGYPRYCAEGGMNTIAKYLASTVDVRCDARVRAIAGDASSLSVQLDDGRRFETDAVIVTCPVPQALSLCDDGWLPIPETEQASLASIAYAPCLALMVTLDGPAAVPWPGGVQIEGGSGVFSFIGDNVAKGISDVPAVTFHCDDATSREHFETDDDQLSGLLLEHARPYLGAGVVVRAQIKRWRFARPTVGHPSSCIAVEPIDATTLVFAGDAFGGAKMEGAALSGLASAEAVLLRQ